VTGDVTFTLWGNAVNQNANNQGDLAATTTRTVTVTMPCTPQSFYRDADTDGFGAGTPTSACAAPAGFVAASGDCNDGVPAIHPGAAETCNGLDDNCSGAADGLTLSAFYWTATPTDSAAPRRRQVACSLAQAGAGMSRTMGIATTPTPPPPSAAEPATASTTTAAAPSTGLPCRRFIPTATPTDSAERRGGGGMACSLAQAGAGFVANRGDCNDASGREAIGRRDLQRHRRQLQRCRRRGFGTPACGVGACADGPGVHERHAAGVRAAGRCSENL
jgi:hypothetical protein